MELKYLVREKGMKTEYGNPQAKLIINLGGEPSSVLRAYEAIKALLGHNEEEV